MTSFSVLFPQVLQNDLEQEQVKVNSLTHMVVVVDENSGESATAVLEEQLQVEDNMQEDIMMPSYCCVEMTVIMKWLFRESGQSCYYRTHLFQLYKIYILVAAGVS